MTRTEILEETFRYYEEKPARRATEDGLFGSRCVYRSETGQMCAVGRCLDWERLDKLLVSVDELNDAGDVMGADSLLLRKDKGGVPGLVKPQYQGQELEFWRDLQIFHDTESYWGDPYADEVRNIYKETLLAKWGEKGEDHEQPDE